MGKDSKPKESGGKGKGKQAASGSDENASKGKGKGVQKYILRNKMIYFVFELY